MLALGYAVVILLRVVHLKEALDHLDSLNLSLFLRDIALLLAIFKNMKPFSFIKSSDVRST